MLSPSANILGSGGLIANTTGGIRGGTLKGSASGELTIYAAQNIPISSTVANNGGPTALVISGPGIVTLSGSALYTGQTYLNNGGLTLVPPVNETYAAAIHGPGDLTKSGTATLTLSGTSDFSGATTITGGALCVNGLLSPNSEVTLQSSAIISGSGTVGGDVTASGGTIAMSPAGSILGQVTVSSGTLTIGGAGGNYLTTPAGLDVTDGASLVVSPSAVIVGSVSITSSANSGFSGVLSGSGSLLTLNGVGGATLTLASSASTTFGGVVLEGGTLKIATTAALGNNPLIVNGGTLDMSGWSTFMLTSLGGSGGILTTSGTAAVTLLANPASGQSSDYSGSIIDGGGVVTLLKEGVGELILAGSNSYSGGTVIIDGTLVGGSLYALPAGGSVVVGAGASLLFGPGSSGSPVIPASVSSVPEPGTAGLLFVAAFGLGLVAYRRASRIDGEKSSIAGTARVCSLSRSDAVTVAVGFNPRTTVSAPRCVSRVATIENQPSLRDEEEYGSTANRGLKPTATVGRRYATKTRPTTEGNNHA